MSFENSLIDYLQQIPDPRHPNGRRHPLWLILLLIIMGIMSGYWGYRSLGTFVERHRRVLIQTFSIRGATVPSYSTIRRVMMHLDYQVFGDVFNLWASQYHSEVSQQWVALDGKSLRNTVTNSTRAEQNFISMVSAFSHNRGLVLGLQVMENKYESEIVVVKNLLSVLDLHNAVLTVDALHCQKKTVAAIIDSGNDYLIPVKKNQPRLHQQVELQCSIKQPIRLYQNTEKTRDRLIQRTIEVFEAPLEIDPQWQGINCVVKVFRQGIRGKQPYQSKEPTYYICSLVPNSSLIAKGIRTHWQIENRLHWIKDVVFQEDRSPKLKGFASINLSILKSWVLNLLRSQGYDSITEGISYLGHDLKAMCSLCSI